MVDITVPAVPKTITVVADGDVWHAVDVSDTGDSVAGSSAQLTALVVKTYVLAASATESQTLTNKTLNSFTNEIHADDIHEEVRNNSGGTLTKGTPVFVSGFHIGSSLATVAACDADDPAKMPCIGVIADDISNNDSGAIIEVGELSGVDTSSFSAGDELFISTTVGQLTSTRPTAAATGVQKVAVVLRSHASQGVVELFGAGRVNDIPNRMATDILRIVDDGDLTKVLEYDVSGISTATTRTLTMPNDDVNLSGVDTQYFQVEITKADTATETGDGQAYFTIPTELAGMNLISVHANVIIAGTTGTTDIQFHNVTQAADMLSTKLTIDSGELSSATAATPPVIDAANDDVAAFDVIRVDVDAISTTPATGLFVTAGFINFLNLSLYRFHI